MDRRAAGERAALPLVFAPHGGVAGIRAEVRNSSEAMCFAGFAAGRQGGGRRGADERGCERVKG